MATLRKPFQGVMNIIRFNWHFYTIAVCTIILFIFINVYTNKAYEPYTQLVYVLIAATTILSLLVSMYVYDLSGFYSFKWIEKENAELFVVNINAGFDETSNILKRKFPFADVAAFDFYDPVKHTEISIKRARKAYPPFPGTKQMDSAKISLPDNSADKIFVVFAAHEIRDEKERRDFFKELRRVIKPSGEIYITEHLRDFPNFLAYNIGFLHFYSKHSWIKIYKTANLFIKKEIKLTPFISTFTLIKNGDSF